MKILVLILTISVVRFTICAQEPSSRNIISVETNIIQMSSITYNRVVPLKDRMDILFGGGYVMGNAFWYGSHWIRIESNLMFFGPRHYVETGGQYLIGINEESSLGFNVAYRFLSKKGLSITANINGYLNRYSAPLIAPTIGLEYFFGNKEK